MKLLVRYLLIKGKVKQSSHETLTVGRRIPRESILQSPFSCFRWTLLQLNNPSTCPDIQMPTGRSWHTMSLVDDYHGLLYGGYDRTGHPVGDCWIVDLNPSVHSSQQQQQPQQHHHQQQPQRWTRLRHLEMGDLLWHCSVSLPSGQVYLVR